VQANALVGLLSLPETAPFRAGWVAWAERVTVRQLHEDVDAGLEAAARAEPPCPPDSVEWQTGAQHAGTEETPPVAEETARFFFSAPIEVARLLRAVVCSVRRRLECTEGAAWGWLFDHALESWGANGLGTGRAALRARPPPGADVAAALPLGRPAHRAVGFAPCSACETSASSG
jgi:hypothetical protein